MSHRSRGPALAVGALLLAAFYSAPSFCLDYWVVPPAAHAPQIPAGPTVMPAYGTAEEFCSESRPCPLSKAVLSSLRPGDRLQLTAGIYPPFRISGLHGTASAPIIISGAVSGMMPRGAESVVVRGNRRTRDTLEITESSHLQLSKLSISGAIRAGIRINASRTIGLNRIDVRGAGKWGVYVDYTNNTRVSSCHIESAGTQHGIYFANSGDGARVEDTYIGGFLGSGIHVNGDLSMGGAPGVAADGIISDLVLVGNWINGTGEAGGAAINLDGAHDVLIKHNLLTNLKAAGVAVFRGDGAAGSDAVRIQGNLIHGAAGSRDLLIFKRSGVDNLLTGNLLLLLNRNAAVISTDRGAWVSDAGRLSNLPFRSRNNLFWSAGSLISVADPRVSAALRGQVVELGMTPLAPIRMLPESVSGPSFAPAKVFEAQPSMVALRRANRYFAAAAPWSAGESFD